MGLTTIAAVGLAILGVFGAAASRQITDEFKAWQPRMTQGLLNLAIRRLSDISKKRYAEEWESYLADTPGDIGKLTVAMGFIFAAVAMSRRQRIFTLRDILSKPGQRDQLPIAQLGLFLWTFRDRSSISDEEYDKIVRDTGSEGLVSFMKSRVTAIDVVKIRWSMLRAWSSRDGEQYFAKQYCKISGRIAREAAKIYPRETHTDRGET